MMSLTQINWQKRCVSIPRSKKVPTSISVGGPSDRAKQLHTPGETTLGPGEIGTLDKTRRQWQ